jgi:hypothetical protein
MHTYTFSTALVSRIVRTLACGCLAIFFAPDSTAQCNTNCPIISIVNCRNIEARIQAQLCCDNTTVTLSETFTVPAGTCRSEPYEIGFLPCYATGTFFIGPNPTTYTWDPQTCTLTIH